MSIGAPSPAHPAVPVRHRLSVENLNPAQLADVRRVFGAAQGVSDDRGYEHWAGIHGLPLPMYCTHGSPLFLPWHRAYLYFFELSLRDVGQVESFAFPWWDWTSPASHAGGIPPAYADQQNNPLYSAAVDPAALSQGQASGNPMPARTQRQPDVPGNLPTQAEVGAALSLGDFLDFSTQIEDLHNRVHGWVGGHMSEIPFAAYDPIFWAHHSFIDRLWRLWQLQHPGATVPSTLQQRALAPFPMTVVQTLDATALGYDYASTTSEP